VADIGSNIQICDPKLEELVATNKFLMEQVTAVLSDGGAVSSLEEEAEKLEQELKMAQRRTSELADVDSPDSGRSCFEAMRTLKILKAQCIGVEEYLRNSAKFERDEIQSRIRRLQRKSASLQKEIREVKEGCRANTAGEARKRRSAGLQSLTELLSAIEIVSEQKQQRIAETRAESDRESRRLDELIKQSQATEAKIKKCRAQIAEVP
jgi:chromosome segregation ATPase